ncbi:LPS export ABC transporter periplasmic protein LptC [Pseudomonas sp. LRF_L74]|uniref:LPS export ABC transporter periplasmic protein LptC n=1 Tax=Pseudomonas sp. LRF_L74 TaxID=3369422 RepID=UPI003F62455D
MSARLRLPIIVLLAALLAAVGYWNIRPESFMDHQAATDAESPVDFYATKVNTRQFQEDGQVHYDMTAERLDHMKASDITELSKPDLQLYRGTAYPWHVQSERAEVAPKGKQVELIDAVRIARTDAKDRPVVITSSRMTVFPDEQYAQTAQAVRIEAANGVTTAQGMKAYLNDGRVFLQSNVRGQHEVR